MIDTIDLRKDESFVALLMSERATHLARVDYLEKFLGLDLTKELRDEVKRLRYEISKLREVQSEQ